VDDIDRKIIRLLQEDARKSFNKISESLGIAVGTAYNRVKNMEDHGILKGYTVMLDSAKLGYGLTALILIEAEGRYLPEVEKELAKLDEVICIYDITGDYDIAVVARFKQNYTKQLHQIGTEDAPRDQNSHKRCTQRRQGRLQSQSINCVGSCIPKT